MKYLFVFFIFALCMGIISSSVRAQTQDYATCDLCGYCKGVVPAPPYKNPPSNWESCRQCLYPSVAPGDYNATVSTTNGLAPSPDPDHHFTVLGCISTRPGEFGSQMTNVFFSAIGGIAFLYLLYGAFTIATSRADIEKLNGGKRMVYGAIIGLLFVLFSTFIIRFIAVTILKIPGFS